MHDPALCVRLMEHHTGRSSAAPDAVAGLIVDDAYAAAALLPLTFGSRAMLPDAVALTWHIVLSAVAARAWLAGRRPSSVILAVVDIELGVESGALLVRQLRGSHALRPHACIVSWSSRDDGAAIARSAGADAFLSKQRMGRSHAPGADLLEIVESLWQADRYGTARPWIAYR